MVIIILLDPIKPTNSGNFFRIILIIITMHILVCYRFVGKYLKVMNRLNGGSDKERKLVQEFTNSYLRQDGVFVLRFVLNT